MRIQIQLRIVGDDSSVISEGEILHLDKGDQGEHRRSRRGLAELREQAGKLAVPVDRAERVGNIEAESPLGESGAGDALGLFRWRGRVFRMERH